MRKHLISVLLIASASCLMASAWAPAGGKILTSWGESLDTTNVLPEYPRPIMERADWKNLNGLWDYAITPVGNAAPKEYDGEILVPFAVESAISGVSRQVGDGQELWYRRSFSVPSQWKGKHVRLNFGAVDWKAEVWVNGIYVGQHTGGYTPFSFDITKALKKGTNEVSVKVWDPTSNGEQPHGKQVTEPNTIWYTPVTGIWQTVWLEPVSETHLTSLRTTPDIDRRTLHIEPEFADGIPDKTEVVIFDGDKEIGRSAALGAIAIDMPMPEGVELWTPENPALYRLTVTAYKDGKAVDKVSSYTAFRKFSTKRDDKGITRLQLNNKDYFQFGPLDQGWWPDGLYTAPTDEALVYDLQKTKDFGFNMVRKHIKVEPARWYTHCDRLGLIVWQDMPSGGPSPQWYGERYFDGSEAQRSPASEANYRKEWKEIIDALYSYPSIGMWVPFNEAWGQFKTPEIAGWTKAYDPSRPVNAASGGNHYQCGDILDLHNYPQPRLYLYDPLRPTVLGEYGGIGLALPGHLWFPDKNWGYIQFKSSDEVTAKYIEYARMLLDLIPKGFSAAVYTQITDVEGEVNGLLTYDRKVVKVDESEIRKINLEISNSLK